jgi:hypothetical protein
MQTAFRGRVLTKAGCALCDAELVHLNIIYNNFKLERIMG